MFNSVNKLYGLFKSVKTAAPALRTTTVQEDLFIQGKAFSYEDYHLFSAGEKKTFVLNPAGCSCGQIVFSPIVFGATAGPILIDYYFGIISAEDGELLGVSNRRATSPIKNGATLRLNPTISGLGTRISGDLIPSTGIAAPNQNGAESPTGLPFEITMTSKWGVTVHNTDGAGVYIGIKMTWFEI